MCHYCNYLLPFSKSFIYFYTLFLFLLRVFLYILQSCFSNSYAYNLANNKPWFIELKAFGTPMKIVHTYLFASWYFLNNLCHIVIHLMIHDSFKDLLRMMSNADRLVIVIFKFTYFSCKLKFMMMIFFFFFFFWLTDVLFVKRGSGISLVEFEGLLDISSIGLALEQSRFVISS